MLAYYFLLTLNFKVKKSTFRWIEPCMHVFPYLFGSSTALVGAGLGVYGPSELIPLCWVDNYPKGCTYDCKSEMIGWIFAGWLGFYSLINLPIVYFLIYRHVRSVYRKTRFGIQGQHSGSISQSETQNLKLIFTQACLYVFAFVCSFWPILVSRLIETYTKSEDLVDISRFYWLLMCQSCFMPLTGMFNALIYHRPNYLELRKLFKGQSRLWTFRRLYMGERLPPNEQSSTESTNNETSLRSSFFFASRFLVGFDTRRERGNGSSLGFKPVERKIIEE